jgi:hypothetical protein
MSVLAGIAAAATPEPISAAADQRSTGTAIACTRCTRLRRERETITKQTSIRTLRSSVLNQRLPCTLRKISRDFVDDCLHVEVRIDDKGLVLRQPCINRIGT